MTTYKVKHLFRLLLTLGLTTTAFAITLKQAKSEETYEARCETRGEGIILTSTGEDLVEARITSSKLLDTYSHPPIYRSLCTIKHDPPGYRWVNCHKNTAGDYFRYIDGLKYRISPVVESKGGIDMAGWIGACKVKL